MYEFRRLEAFSDHLSGVINYLKDIWNKSHEKRYIPGEGTRITVPEEDIFWTYGPKSNPDDFSEQNSPLPELLEKIIMRGGFDKAKEFAEFSLTNPNLSCGSYLLTLLDNLNSNYGFDSRPVIKLVKTSGSNSLSRKRIEVCEDYRKENSTDLDPKLLINAYDRIPFGPYLLNISEVKGNSGEAAKKIYRIIHDKEGTLNPEAMSTLNEFKDISEEKSNKKYTWDNKQDLSEIIINLPADLQKIFPSILKCLKELNNNYETIENELSGVTVTKKEILAKEIKVKEVSENIQSEDIENFKNNLEKIVSNLLKTAQKVYSVSESEKPYYEKLAELKLGSYRGGKDGEDGTFEPKKISGIPFMRVLDEGGYKTLINTNPNHLKDFSKFTDDMIVLSRSTSGYKKIYEILSNHLESVRTNLKTMHKKFQKQTTQKNLEKKEHLPEEDAEEIQIYQILSFIERPSQSNINQGQWSEITSRIKKLINSNLELSTIKYELSEGGLNIKKDRETFFTAAAGFLLGHLNLGYIGKIEVGNSGNFLYQTFGLDDQKIKNVSDKLEEPIPLIAEFNLRNVFSYVAYKGKDGQCYIQPQLGGEISKTLWEIVNNESDDEIQVGKSFNPGSTKPNLREQKQLNQNFENLRVPELDIRELKDSELNKVLSPILKNYLKESDEETKKLSNNYKEFLKTNPTDKQHLDYAIRMFPELIRASFGNFNETMDKVFSKVNEHFSQLTEQSNQEPVTPKIDEFSKTKRLLEQVTEESNKRGGGDNS